MSNAKSALSVFVDESGTFRHPDHSSRYYIVGLVFHDQAVDILRLANELDVATARMGLDPEVFASHAGHSSGKKRLLPRFAANGGQRCSNSCLTSPAAPISSIIACAWTRDTSTRPRQLSPDFNQSLRRFFRLRETVCKISTGLRSITIAGNLQ